MNCPHCGGKIDQTDGDLLAPLGLGAEAERLRDLALAPATTPRTAKQNSGRIGGNRRARLAADWQPTAEQRLYCEQQGKDPEAFTKVFVEYYLAKGTAWTQWGLVWMKACREWQGHVAAKPESPKETLREKELNLWRQRLKHKMWNGFWGPAPGQPGCMVPRELLP